MKKLYILVAFIISFNSFAQDVLMQDGTFNRCEPDMFYDTGGASSSYSSDEDYTITICPEDVNNFVIINFLSFSTQLNTDVLSIYDGDDTTAQLIGTYSGASSPGTVQASIFNTSGCLTFHFVSDGSGTTSGWSAEILCAEPCQTITPSITSTPAVGNSGSVQILPGDSVDFLGSATFSNDGTGATYNWDFGNGTTDTGTSVSTTFTTAGTYTVTLTVEDTNPQGCSGVETISVFVLGPNVVVDQDTYTVEELIVDVLIDSPCAEVSNVTFSTGTTYGEDNGIGYFYGNGVSFPFQDGLLMTSGDASLAGGPNSGGSLSDGSSSWLGDTELDDAVGLTGTDTSNNATIIEFDFVPLADSISFNFLMASEEYDGGSFECNYSDAFAFLLTDELNNVTNLAVLPATTTPILVTNIHGANSSCGAVNEQYFGAYTPNGQPPIAFDGRTGVFTAQSAVNPGETYHIKLVIADSRDNSYDSGVFIEAGSFNIGGTLGDDLTIAAANTNCETEAITLNTNASIAVHTWYKDGVVIPGNTGSTLVVTEDGEYTVDVVFSASCQSTDSIIIEFYPAPTVASVENLSSCTANTNADFDLTLNNSNVIGTQDPTLFNVAYYQSLTDAENGTNEIPIPGVYSGTDGEIIYVRIQDIYSEGCYDVSQFELSIGSPSINPVLDLITCDDDSNDGFEEFDLSSQDLGILGAQPAADFTVSYYTSFADADSGTDALTSPYTNTANPQPIFVRVESAGDSSCYIASPTAVFSLVVNTRAIANPIDNQVLCDDPSNDGAEVFDLTSQEATVLGTQDATVYNITYYIAQSDAENSSNAIPNPSAYSNIINPQTIHVRVEDPLYPECYGYTSFDIIVNEAPAVIVPTTLFVCDDDADGFAAFMLSDKNTEILNGQTGLIVSYYPTLTDAEDATNALTEPYTNTTVTTETVFVRLENTTTGCYNTTTLDLEVSVNPVAVTPTALEVCDDDNDGFSTFDLTLKSSEILGGQTGMTVSFYETQSDAENAVNPLASPYDNINPGSQTVFGRLENDASGCYDTVELILLVNPLPTVPTITAFELCDYDNPGDEVEQFDLSSKDTEIINGQVNIGVSYYETEADAEAGTNALIGLYTNTSNPQTIYVQLENTNTGCIEVGSFNLDVNPLPTYVVPTPLEVCDDNVPDGITDIDLTLKNNEISGNNPNYSMSYYTSQANADTATSALTMPYTGTDGEIVFVRVQDINTGCYATTTLTLVVEQAPVANQPTALEYCDPDSDGFGVFTLTDSDNEITGGVAGLTVSYHETMADADNDVNPLASPYNNIVANSQTVYARVESATIATDCATIVTLELIVNPTPQLGVGPTPLEVCDDISADGLAQFNLSSKDAEILSPLADPTLYTVTYYEVEANAESGTNAILTPAAYTNTTPFNQTLWVRVDDNVNGCYKVTTLELIVNALPVLVQPSPLELCDYVTLGDEQEAFTLEDANDEILNGQTGIGLSYYETQADADAGTGEITGPYTNTVNPQTVYVRAENNVTGCYNTITLNLRVNPVPSPEANPEPIEECDPDNDGFASFDLETRTVEIINGELDIAITYHETQADADNAQNALTSPYENIVANTQVVFARAENTITGCYAVVELTLNVLPSPVVPTAIEDYVICDTDSNGISQFDLTTKDAEILGTQDETLFTLTYHLSQVNAEDGTNPIVNTTSYTNQTNPQTLYVRLESIANGCVTTGEFEIRVELPPVAIQPTRLALCDDDIADEVTVFDLTVKDNEITGGEASWSVSYYETQADADSGTNAVDATAYTNTSVGGAAANPQTLYAVVTDTDTGCTDMTTLTIRVLPNPTPSLDPSDLELCDDTNPGDGVEAFDLTLNEVYILNGETGVTPSYYESEADAEAGANAIATPTAYENIDSPTQTVYVRVTNDITGCFTLVNFDIIVHPLPDAVAITDYIFCEDNTDGFAGFDLTTKDAEVLNGQDATLFEVTYHATQLDADDLMNALVSPYTNTTNTQQVFVAITNTITGCSVSTESFNLEVQEAAEANNDGIAIVYELCDDNMETDTDATNDTVQFDLTTQNEFLLDGQDPVDYTVTYYATEAEAELGVNPLPTLYENVINPQVIYGRVDNDTTPDSICYAVAELTLDVNPQPVFTLDDSYVLCVSSNGSEVINTPILETGLTSPEYTFVWYLNSVEIAGASSPSYIPTEGGTYSVTVTDVSTSTVTMCERTDSTEVIESAPPTIVADVLTDAFSETHIIEAIASGAGEYEYSLDNGPWQLSGVFEDVSSGDHVVTARDMNGCGTTDITVTVLDYPVFFTPNGDGYHDTWNIIGFANQPSVKIYIFDRYGKLMKQISPSGDGWDGNYNGNPMPTSDYWFVVEYNEPNTGARKEFKAHFTLKR